MVYVAFVVDAYAQRIVGWHPMSTRPAELVLLPLRMAAWARGQQGHLIGRGELVHHSDAGSQAGSPSTCSSKASRPRSAASVTPTTTP
jgi:putative transposase